MHEISIVTCSYNQGRFLDTTIRSVLNQNITKLEYIVIDGASTDGSPEIIESHAHDLAYWVSEKDLGQSNALNKGLIRASGSIVGWLCSDDVLLPGALDEVSDYFERNPDVDAVYGDSVLINDVGAPLRPKREIEFSSWLLACDHNYIPQPSMFWRRAVHDQVGYLREDLHLTMDLEFWLRLAEHGLRIRHVNRFWSGMRCHGDQKVFTQNEALRLENILLREKYAPEWSKRMPETLNRLMARSVRIGLKMAAGGYRSKLPSEVELYLSMLALNTRRKV